MSAQPSQQQIAQANLAARQLVLNQAIDMRQQIAAGSLSSPLGAVVNVPIRNVGLLKRLIIEISGTFKQSAAETQTLTAWGPANVLSNVTLTDLNNQTRVNTTGWHLHALATARRQMAYAAAFTNDSPVSIGSNNNVMIATSSVTSSAKTFRAFYEIPIAYGDYDLRGAIYANVVNATMNLQFTFNPNFSVASTADGTLAVYKSSSTDLGTLASVAYTVYQHYLDQLPMTNQGPVLPSLDLSTVYLLNNTAATALVASQDYPIPFANFRNFMSFCAIYDNGGTLTAGGTDVNYWALQSANYTNIFKVDPYYAFLQTRNIIGDDFPSGTYYFDFRNKPISTIQYGNMQMVVNPITVNSNAQLLIGFEALALMNQITNAGSLYAN